MKVHRLLLPMLLFLCMATYAQKDTCTVGVYVSNLYDFNVDGKSFMADFWIWINYKNDSPQFENAQEITNSKSSDFSYFTLGKKRWLALGGAKMQGAGDVRLGCFVFSV